MSTSFHNDTHRGAASGSSPEPAAVDDEPLEGLLAELSSTTSPETWARIEELIRQLTHLYGNGLERLVRYASAGPERFARDCASDALVSELLALHGLQASSVRRRVEHALDSVRPYLASHAATLEVREIRRGGTLDLQLSGCCDGCVSSRGVIEQAIRRVLAIEAPEITSFHLTMDDRVHDRPALHVVRGTVGSSPEQVS